MESCPGNVLGDDDGLGRVLGAYESASHQTNSRPRDTCVTVSGWVKGAWGLRRRDIVLTSAQKPYNVGVRVHLAQRVHFVTEVLERHVVGILVTVGYGLRVPRVSLWRGAFETALSTEVKHVENRRENTT